jgi:hypothetical protein
MTNLNSKKICRKIMNKGVMLFAIAFGMLMLVWGGGVLALSIDYVSPTPANNAANTSIYLNVSADETADHYIFTDWNNSVVGWWMFDYFSSNGLTVYDNSSKANHATNSSTFNASTDLVAGYWGQGWNATKSAGYLRLNNAPQNTFTISFWIKADANPGARTYLLTPSSGTYLYISHETTGKLMIRYTSGDYTATLNSIGTAWHHIAIIVSTNGQSGTSIWTDGVSGVSSSGTSAGPVTFAVSSYNLGTTINATLDDIIIFNRSLTDAEVKSLYNASANKYYADFSLFGSAGNSYLYKSYIVNTSSNFNVSETRNFTLQKAISSVSYPDNNRHYTSLANFSIVTNFDASCKYSLNSGQDNFSMSSTNNRNFNATNSSIPIGAYTANFYCNDSTDSVSNSVYFTIDDHLTYYVNKDASGCSNSYSKNYASNESTPLCTIAEAESKASAGDEIVVKYGDYCEGIATTKSGTADEPIIIRGESNAQRTILNGTCSNSVSYINGISISDEDNRIFRYFYIYNFSNDGMNIHDDSQNITFENITAYLNGYNTGAGAAGDGISSHETSNVIGRWINLTKNTKSCATDVFNTTTFYYNSHCQSPDNWGWYFGATPEILQTQYMEDTYSYDTPICLKTGSNFTAFNFVCEHNNFRGSYVAALIYDKENVAGDDYINIDGLNIIDTNPVYDAILTTDLKLLNLTDGYFDNNISLVNSTAVLTNMTYEGSEEVDSNSVLTRKWYLDSSSNINNTNITITNSSGNIVYSNLTNGSIPQQTLMSYINNGGTQTNYSNYTISASVEGYATNTTLVNLTENKDIVFTLTENIAPQITINSPTPSQAFTTSSVLLNVTINENGTCLYSTNAGTTNSSMDTTNNLTFTKTLSLADGSYTANFYCNDTLGNMNNTMNVSFSIAVPVTEGSTASSGGGIYVRPSWDFTYANDYSELKNLPPLLYELEERQRVTILVDSEKHYVGVTNINGDKVTINVSSNKSQQAILKPGETTKFEINNDSYYDIKIELNNIYKILGTNRANLTISYIHEKIQNSSNNSSIINISNNDNSDKCGIGQGKNLGLCIKNIIGNPTLLFFTVLIILIIWAVYTEFYKKKRY